MSADPGGVRARTQGEPAGEALAVRGASCAAGARPLFTQVDLGLPAGRWALLTGPNGSGKTTLLRMIAGLIRPLAGQIRWQGRVQDPRTPDWRARVLYQGHASGLKAEFSARENLATQLALDEGRPPTDASLDAALSRVGLSRARHVAGARLSAGQQRRVLLARLVCSRRPIWLLDEPANALDVDALSLLATLIDEHLARGGCALVASHQPLPTTSAPRRLQLGPTGIRVGAA